VKSLTIQEYNALIESEKDEKTIQRQTVRYIRDYYPGALFTISPAGMLQHKPSRNFLYNMVNMGYTKGTPDLMIFEPAGIYCGLFIELKKMKTGKASPEQNIFIKKLNERKYKAVICYGRPEAIKTIDDYFKPAEIKPGGTD